MTFGLTECVQRLLDMIEKRDATWFIGCALAVALVSLWGL
jgi:hypothetical protein